MPCGLSRVFPLMSDLTFDSVPLVHFSGPWTRAGRTVVASAVAAVETGQPGPLRRFDAVWICTAVKGPAVTIYFASRRQSGRVLRARSAPALARKIRKRGRPN